MESRWPPPPSSETSRCDHRGAILSVKSINHVGVCYPGYFSEVCELSRNIKQHDVGLQCTCEPPNLLGLKSETALQKRGPKSYTHSVLNQLIAYNLKPRQCGDLIPGTPLPQHHAPKINQTQHDAPPPQHPLGTPGSAVRPRI